MMMKKYDIVAVLHNDEFSKEASIGQFAPPMVLHRMMSPTAISKVLGNSFRSVRIDQTFGAPVAPKNTRSI